MAAQWAKSYLPRTLYGRAALILLVPVVLLQLLVSVAFIQRHYEGVTEQMTRNVVLDLQLLLDLVEAAPDAAAGLDAGRQVSKALDFDLALPVALPDSDAVLWFDLSAWAMMRTLRAELPQTQRFDTTIDDQVWVWIATRHGTMSATFDPRRISAPNPHQLLVLMIVGGALFTLVAILFLRNQLRPIRRLARASEAFGRGQTLAYEPRGALEVRAAGRAFVAMRARIERQIEQRTMMLSGISHDLRTPLTRLKLGLSMQDDSAEIREMLRDVDDMERLVEEFLAFARGDALEDAEVVSPTDLVRDVVARHRASGADVTLRDGATPDPVALHPLAVARALDNLIGNAVKYGRRAEISLEERQASIRFVVEDDGPGIPEASRPEALKPFARLDQARNQDRGGGVGLGLAIAHDIARRHGGALELGDSTSMGGLRAVLVVAR